MPKFSRRRLAEAIVKLLNQHPERQVEILRSTAAYLVENGLTKQVELLARDISRQLQQTRGELSAEVESAFGLTDSSRLIIESYLKAQTGAKSVTLEETQNPSLISGVVIKTVDQELDLSAKRQLQQLASLNSGGIK